MTKCQPHHTLIADRDRLNDAHLGLLLSDLQLGTGITERPERYRQGLALLANADGRPQVSEGDASRRRQEIVRAA